MGGSRPLPPCGKIKLPCKRVYFLKMEQKENKLKAEEVMKNEHILPEDFDGTFRFTNWTDEEFVAKWDGKEYVFPARTTSPMLILNQTPLEVQNIRKKFAKDLAEREFFKTPAYAKLLAQEKNSDGSPRANSIHMAGTYSLDEIAGMIQKCLLPLQLSKAQIREAKKFDLEGKLSKDAEGNLNSIAIDRKISLKEKALSGSN